MPLEPCLARIGDWRYVLRLYADGVRIPMSRLRAAKPKHGLLQRVQLEIDRRATLEPSNAVQLLDEDGRLAVPPLLNGQPYYANNYGQLYIGHERLRRPNHTTALVFQAWFALRFPRDDNWHLPTRDDYLPRKRRPTRTKPPADRPDALELFELQNPDLLRI